MSIATLEPTTVRPVPASPTAASDLLSAHLDFAAAAAELDLTPAARWIELDRIIAAATADAYHLAARFTGDHPGAPAGRLTPVARLRELARAQRALGRAMQGAAAFQAGAAAAQSAARVRRLAGRLRTVAADPR